MLLKLFKHLLVILMFITASVVQAESPQLKVFTPESYNRILNKNDGNEFTLVFWSVICSPCLKELKHVGENKMYLHSKFIFVSIDGSDLLKDVKDFIKQAGLQTQQHWIFNEQQRDEIVQAVDENWYGEVPRNYFFDDEGNRMRIRSIK